MKKFLGLFLVLFACMSFAFDSPSVENLRSAYSHIMGSGAYKMKTYYDSISNDLSSQDASFVAHENANTSVHGITATSDLALISGGVAQFSDKTDYATVASGVAQFADKTDYATVASGVAQFADKTDYATVAGGVAQFSDKTDYATVAGGVAQFSDRYTDADAQAAAVADSITDAITDVAPSQNAVYDALAVRKLYAVVADFDCSSGCAIGTKASGITIPDNAIVKQAYYEIISAFASAGGSGTIALNSEGVGDILAPVDADTLSGINDGIPTGTATNMIKLSAARELIMTIATDAMTSGRLKLFVEYVISE